MSALTMSYPTSDNTIGGSYEERLCKFCNSTIKKLKCRIFGHVDGCMVKLSRFAIQRENERRNSFDNTDSYYNNPNRITSDTYYQKDHNRCSTDNFSTESLRNWENNGRHIANENNRAVDEYKRGGSDKSKTYSGFNDQTEGVYANKTSETDHPLTRAEEKIPEPPVDVPAPPEPSRKFYFDISKPREKPKDIPDIKPATDPRLQLKRERDTTGVFDISAKKQQVPVAPVQPPTADVAYQPYLPPPSSNPLPLEPIQWPSARLNLTSIAPPPTTTSHITAASAATVSAGSSVSGTLKHSASEPGLARLTLAASHSHETQTSEAHASGSGTTASGSSAPSTPTTAVNPRWAASLNRLKALQEANSIAKPTPTPAQASGDPSEEVSSRWLLAADEHTVREKYFEHRREKEQQRAMTGPGLTNSGSGHNSPAMFAESIAISTSSKLQAVKGIIKKDHSQKAFEVVPVGRNKKIYATDGSKTGSSGSAESGVQKVYTIPIELVRSLHAAHKQRKIRWRDMESGNGMPLQVLHEYEQVLDIVLTDVERATEAYAAAT